MTGHATANRHRYLLGGGLSVLAHVALVLGFPSARASVPPSAGTEAGLVWLDSDAGDGAALGGSLALGSSESSAPAAPSRTAPRREAPVGTPRTERTAEPSAEHSSLAAATTAGEATTNGVSPANALAEGGSVAGATGHGAAPVAGDGSGAGSGSGAGAGASGGTGAGVGEPVHGPRLLAVGNPCAGYFPAGAHAAHGRVQVEVEVGSNGRIESTRVMAEQPLNEGFGGAARACADRLLFTPAHTSQGTPVEGHARLLLSFDRS